MKLQQTISSIHVDSDVTWKFQPFLTFDVDWANDEVLLYTIDLVESADVAATWFVTHDTPILARLRENPKFELGIHPNFNFLLQGDGRKGNSAREVIDNLMRIVPEARAVRSHSLTQNSHILDVFKEVGLTHDSNHFIPYESEMATSPWRHWNGVTRTPYFWADDVECLHEQQTRPVSLVANNGLKIFDFHPIHVYLNTDRVTRYNSARSHLQTVADLEVFRNHGGDGIEQYLLELIGLSCA